MNPLLLLKWWRYGAMIVLAAIAGWYAHEAHKWESKVAQVLNDDQAALIQAKVNAAAETSRLKGIADAAEKKRADEHDELVSYRASDPLHGGLCKSESHRLAHVPQTSGAKPGHADPSPSATTVQSMPAGDPAASGQSGPDIRHLLDVLAGRADEVSATLREFQAR